MFYPHLLTGLFVRGALADKRVRAPGGAFVLEYERVVSIIPWETVS